MALSALPTLRSPFRLAVVALASCLWMASCAPDSGEALFQDLRSPLTEPPPRTLLVHISYGTEETLSQLSGELDLLEHADRKAGTVDALVDEETYAALAQKGVVMAIDDRKLAHLRRDPRCVLVIFETVRPFRGVRITGRATLVPDDGALARLAVTSRYLGPAGGAAYSDLGRRPPGVVVRLPLADARAWDLRAAIPDLEDGATA